MAEKSLKSYWIEGNDPRGPVGFGVTAYSVMDALEIIDTAGYVLSRDKGRLSYRPVKSVQDVEYAIRRRKCGPIAPRGLWSPWGLGRLKGDSDVD